MDITNGADIRENNYNLVEDLEVKEVAAYHS